MWNEPTEKQLSEVPALYSTEDIPLKEKIVYLHFFLGSYDWFACEYDGRDLFFGYVILNGDLTNSEWG